MALALYRRYRPDTFDGVIGQDQVTVPLSRALDQGKITHAYLFSGPRGCGKTSSARILARCINCEQGPTPHPCGKCQSCKDLSTGGSGSIDVVEIDAASHNGVDDARELRERAGFAPARDRYKIFILDEAHMVTPQGFNALLKIVEEPPEHVMFIFATTEPDKVIGTIRSRTHHYPFRLVPPEVMGPYLEDICKKEGILPAPGVLRLAMRAGAGSMRDTLSVLDQLMVGAVDNAISLDSAVALLGFTPSSLINKVVDALIERNGAAVYDVVRRVIVGGYDTRKFVEDLLGRVRDLLLIVSAGEHAASELLNDIAPEDLQTLQQQSSKISLHDLANMAQTINSALSGMSSAVSPRMNLEILMARLLADSEVINNPAANSSNMSANANVNVNRSFIQTNATSQAQSQPQAQSQSQPSNSSASSAGHFIGSKRNNSNNSVINANNNAQDSTANAVPNDTSAINASAEVAKPAVSSEEVKAEKAASNNASKSNSQNNTSKSTDEMWNEVVEKLPEDVREYVTREYVPQVQLISQQSIGRQRLVMTFNEPMSQHAFALAVCTTSPYDGQKVPKVVMTIVHDVFGSNVMIAPAPVAENGEQVESVARMDPQRLAKVKRDILLRKTGITAGFSNSKADSESSGANKSSTEKGSSDFQQADGTAASVIAENTAEEENQQTKDAEEVLQNNTQENIPSADLDFSNADDAWADMSSVPMADVIAFSSAEQTTSTENNLQEQAQVDSLENSAESSQNFSAEVSPEKREEVSSENTVNIAEPAYSEESSLPVSESSTPSSGATADECSMDDASLESSNSVSIDDLKQMFEVKTVEEFAASDPKNPKNATANAKKRQEE